MKCHIAASNLRYVLQVSDGMQTGKIESGLYFIFSSFISVSSFYTNDPMMLHLLGSSDNRYVERIL
jgi:hypothetical protein